MVVLVVEAMGVQMRAILMGTAIIKATTLPAILELETILQPIPMGMIIQGLELKSKFARRLSVFSFCAAVRGCRPFPARVLHPELADTIKYSVRTTDTLEVTAIRTETVVMVALMVMEGEGHMAADLVEALAATKCPILAPA